jgi:magnesium-transporting ATPase (P-type)
MHRPLKEADVVLLMGIQGIEVAKESSNIVILDENFNLWPLF